ncbi:MAG TPA: DUF3576 domain-containing protein [Candidatus Sulfotelmatobacter sp.]|nr:DUF3576 domain-containing protein [Candidatus Sulfotelmatobacter sp.]
MVMHRKLRTALGLCLILGLAACSEGKTIAPSRQQGDTTPTWGDDQKKETIFGKSGLDLFGGDKKKDQEQGSGIGVNFFLWRASLDTISFMPLSSADPFGGVVITDWYSPPESGNERFKMTILILDRALRADGVRVSVFRQVQNSAGEWTDAAVDPKTATDMENTILTRAREMRTAAQAAK